MTSTSQSSAYTFFSGLIITALMGVLFFGTFTIMGLGDDKEDKGDYKNYRELVRECIASGDHPYFINDGSTITEFLGCVYEK